MEGLIIYDSVYGNTEQIAQAIGNALSSQMDVEVIRINDMNTIKLTGLKLLIIGSPTHGGSATEAVQDFLKHLSESTIQDINVAAFDTRLTTRLVKIFGYASGKIANSLKKKGGILIASPEPFFVQGRKGPLKEGELERAARWANDLVKQK
ncbi:MAG: flavodoxin family protein [Candidatus Thorarchaeota archaeon]